MKVFARRRTSVKESEKQWLEADRASRVELDLPVEDGKRRASLATTSWQTAAVARGESAVQVRRRTVEAPPPPPILEDEDEEEIAWSPVMLNDGDRDRARCIESGHRDARRRSSAMVMTAFAREQEEPGCCEVDEAVHPPAAAKKPPAPPAPVRPPAADVKTPPKKPPPPSKPKKSSIIPSKQQEHQRALSEKVESRIANSSAAGSSSPDSSFVRSSNKTPQPQRALSEVKSNAGASSANSAAATAALRSSSSSASSFARDKQRALSEEANAGTSSKSAVATVAGSSSSSSWKPPPPLRGKEKSPISVTAPAWKPPPSSQKPPLVATTAATKPPPPSQKQPPVGATATTTKPPPPSQKQTTLVAAATTITKPPVKKWPSPSDKKEEQTPLVAAAAAAGAKKWPLLSATKKEEQTPLSATTTTTTTKPPRKKWPLPSAMKKEEQTPLVAAAATTTTKPPPRKWPLPSAAKKEEQTATATAATTTKPPPPPTAKKQNEQPPLSAAVMKPPPPMPPPMPTAEKQPKVEKQHEATEPREVIATDVDSSCCASSSCGSSMPDDDDDDDDDETAMAAAGPEDSPEIRRLNRRSNNILGPRVAALVEGFEALAAAAEREAERQAAFMRERDPAKARVALAARRARALEEERRMRNEARCGTVKFVNVSAKPGVILVQLESATPGAIISFALVNKEQSLKRMIKAEWTELPSHSKARIQITAPGRHVVLAKASNPDLADSSMSSSVWWLAPPSLLNHEAHEHSLRWALKTPSEARCFKCRSRLNGKAAYVCAETCSSDFALCFHCAFNQQEIMHDKGELKDSPDGAESPVMAPITWAPQLAPPASSAKRRPPPPSVRRPPLSVATDTGAKRLWLSEPIEFDGNRATIKLRSFPMLSLLAGTLRRNPALCVRVEGHTNSECGLACDGHHPCKNTTCAQEFFGRGGAMGFSLARAAAVRDWLLSPQGGNLGAEAEDRIKSCGHGGSRRLVDDTEGPDNNLNRRVEAHIVEF